MDSKNEYVLDFVIPAGATGATGPAGLPSLCSITFANTNTVGKLQIDTSQVFPSNTNDYSITNDTITIQSPGNYEITFCGKISRNTSNRMVEIKLVEESSGVTTPLPGMYGKWLDGTQMIHFSQTSIYQFDTSKILSVLIEIQSNTDFMADYVNLIVKKLPI